MAVLVDDSRSMAVPENETTRLAQAEKMLTGGLLASLQKKFQVRLYRFGKGLERIQEVDQLSGTAPATRIGVSLEQTLAEASTLPLGSVVLLSDGSDNSGGIDLDTIGQIRRAHVPVHTIGFGRERLARDVEVSDVSLPVRALADSRLSAEITFRQFGCTREKARLVVREGDRLLASREVTLKAEATPQTEALVFNAGLAGPRIFNSPSSHWPARRMSKQPGDAPGECDVRQTAHPLFRRRAEVGIQIHPSRNRRRRSLQLASIVRTTQNKIYRQGIQDAKELLDGFPSKPEELFAFDGLIIGSTEAGYFTPQQQQLMRDFVDRRGGGVLFLGGRAALSDGGWAHSPLAELLPVRISEAKDTFHRDPRRPI